MTTSFKDTGEIYPEVLADGLIEYMDAGHPGAAEAGERVGARAAELAAADRRWPVARQISEIKEPPPPALLSAAGRGGAILTEGEVTMLSGAGGDGKSLMAISIAVGFAMAVDDHNPTLKGGLFDAPTSGGDVLMVAYEDRAAIIADRVRRLGMLWGAGDDALERIRIMDMRGFPMYGPTDRPNGGAGLYSARPGPMDGWAALWAAVRTERLIIIDPVLSAYAGESNNPAPVREFLAALGVSAEKAGAGVLLIAHSTKAARRETTPDPFDPGQVAGSGAWADGVRGVMVLTRGDGGTHTLAIPKANLGAAFIKTAAKRITADRINSYPDPVGYTAGGGGWQGKDDTAAAAAGGDDAYNRDFD